MHERPRWITALIVVGCLAIACQAQPTPSERAAGTPSLASGDATLGPGTTQGTSSPGPQAELDSATKIDNAEQAGLIDHDTALVDQLYAALDYASLPAEYRSSNPEEAEATGILAELAGRLDALPAETQAKVRPFFLRPTDPASFWQARSAAATADAGSIELAVAQPAFAYQFIDAKANVRIWYAAPLGAVEQARAQQLADEVDASTMWTRESAAMLGHEPCTDAYGEQNGGDGHLDLYLVYPATGLDWGGRKDVLGSNEHGAHRGITLTDGPGLGCPLTTFILINGLLDFAHLKSTTAHELFHAFQFSFNNAVLNDRLWWAEASATWAMSFIYPELNFEQDYLAGYWSKIEPEGPLDSTRDTSAYAVYLWPFYLVQQSGDPSGTVVGRLWQASEGMSPIKAMGALPGWSDRFKEFALWNWNRDSVVKYVDAGTQIPPTKLSQIPACIGESKDCKLLVGKSSINIFLDGAMVQYFEGVPDRPSVRLLKFDLSELQAKPGVAIQAILSMGANGATKVEDWTGLAEKEICVDNDDVHKIVLVVSDSYIASTASLFGALPVEALAGGCDGWRGTMTAKRTWTIETPSGQGYGTATSSFEGLWTLDAFAHTTCLVGIEEVEVDCATYRPTGTVTWTWDAHIPGDPACNSTTSGSLDPAAVREPSWRELDFAPVDKDHFQVSGSGYFEGPDVKCGVAEMDAHTAPPYFELLEQASKDHTPGQDGSTCYTTTWQIEVTATTFKGSCIRFAYNFPGYSTHSLTYSWDLTRTATAHG